MSARKPDMIRVDRAEYEAFKDAAESTERRIRVAEDRVRAADDSVRAIHDRATALVRAAEDAAEDHRLAMLKAQEHYAACLEINKEQATRLARHGLVVTNFNEQAAACDREIARLTKELADTRAELAHFKPATLNVGPPALARRTA